MMLLLLKIFLRSNKDITELMEMLRGTTNYLKAQILQIRLTTVNRKEVLRNGTQVLCSKSLFFYISKQQKNVHWEMAVEEKRPSQSHISHAAQFHSYFIRSGGFEQFY